MERWKERKAKAVEYKGGCCQHCGYDKSLYAMDFHHTDPKQKELGWNKMRLKSWDKVKEELDKCVLLCSNCHREEHERLFALSS